MRVKWMFKLENIVSLAERRQFVLQFLFSPFHRGPLNQMIRKIAKKTGNGDFTTFLFLFSPYSAEPTVSKNLNSLSDCCRPANIYKCGENKLQSPASKQSNCKSIVTKFEPKDTKLFWKATSLFMPFKENKDIYLKLTTLLHCVTFGVNLCSETKLSVLM